MTIFFSCDWGTTSFRLRRVNAATGDVIVPNLVVGERADQQVSAHHVGQRGFCVGWTEDKLIPDNATAKIGRQFTP
jgi:hypothetical protein